MAEPANSTVVEPARAVKTISDIEVVKDKWSK